MVDSYRASRRASQRALLTALGITVCFMAAEAIGGILTNSLALLADAGHMLSDVAALTLASFAIWMAMRPDTPSRTFGFHRVEILAALTNGVILVFIAGYVFWQAAGRFQEPPEVNSGPMLAVAAAGLLANAASGLILYRHSERSLNVRGAYLHILGDLAGSVGAVAAGVVMLASGWFLADPLTGVFIGLLVLFSSVRLLRESLGVLLEAVPAGLDVREVERVICAVEGVRGLHDLHIWTLTSGFVALSAHCELDGQRDTDSTLAELCSMLHHRFGIRHVTIQPEVRLLHGRAARHSLPRCISTAGDEHHEVTAHAPTPESGG